MFVWRSAHFVSVELVGYLGGILCLGGKRAVHFTILLPSCTLYCMVLVCLAGVTAEWYWLFPSEVFLSSVGEMEMGKDIYIEHIDG